jgi:SagB-type dehydrogenase family enzyme
MKVNEGLFTRREFLRVAGAGTVLFLSQPLYPQQDQKGQTIEKISQDELSLPEPAVDGKFAVEKAIKCRRSRRNYKKGHISKDGLSQLLWAAQGITDKLNNLRSAPSAGALYPMEVYAVLPKGVYVYTPSSHSIKKVLSGDKREGLYKVSLEQELLKAASCILVICAIYERSSIKYGGRAKRYCMIEAGAIGENIYLQAESLGLGTCMVGAFNDRDVQRVLGLKKSIRPILLMPIGLR